MKNPIRLALLCFLLFNSIGFAYAQLPVPPSGFDKYNANIAHGKMEIVEYYSSTIGVYRKVRIYTPPNYTTNNKYNVLYLLHGIGGDINEWYTYSHPENILDNLYAQGKLEPMVVVFPNGRAKASDSPGSDMYSAENVAAFEKFEFELLNDLIPFMEKNYPLYKHRLSRAIGGYSMGGGQTYNFGLAHLDVFAWVGGIAGAPTTKPAAQLITNPQLANDMLKLLFVTVGDADGLFGISKGLHDNFTSRGINHIWQVEPGIGHETAMWQRGLYNIAPRLFKGINTSCNGTQQNGFPVCCGTNPDPDGDGWGWENNQSCVVKIASSSSSSKSSSKSSIASSKASSSTAAYPNCASAASDPDGDGWGWENNQSCIVVKSSSSKSSAKSSVASSKASSSAAAYPNCASAASDPDGDGWGWENNKSCIVVKSASCNWYGTSYPLCTTTTSGWGWENNKSCISQSTCSSQ